MTKPIVLPSGNIFNPGPLFGVGGRDLGLRISATLNDLRCRHERFYVVVILPPGSGIEYVAVSDMRLWLGLPKAQRVATFPHREVAGLVITDPTSDGHTTVTIRIGGGDWEIAVHEASLAKELFSAISTFAFPDLRRRSESSQDALDGFGRRRRAARHIR